MVGGNTRKANINSQTWAGAKDPALSFCLTVVFYRRKSISTIYRGNVHDVVSGCDHKQKQGDIPFLILCHAGKSLALGCSYFNVIIWRGLWG